MGEKLVVGPINGGLRNDRTAFVIDNDSFPTLINAFQWRGRIKRKRGTELLTRLTRFFNSSSISYSSTSTITLDGGGNGNILTGFSLQTNGNVVPGSVTLVGSSGPTTYTDPTEDGYLTPTGTGGPNTINYASGAILIPAQAGNTITATFLYTPDLPVMGLEDLILQGLQFPGTLGFDTTYSYNILTTYPYSSYDVSFYKNPASGVPATYVQKTNWTPTSWNGKDYQQFWTVNYQGALWATNGINIPFSAANVGMQYAPSTSIAYVSITGTTVLTVTITGSPLVVGDFVFLNEWTGTNAATLNFQTGYVISVVGTTYEIAFPSADIGAGPYTPGIIQYLTNRSSTTQDCLRWYDGDPTNGNATTPGFTPGLGWVNFAPPLSQMSYPIADSPSAVYYLVGARMIVPFKDRLLFIGPVIQTSGANSQIYLQDTVIYSQNGTPYYTASFSGNIFAPTMISPLLVPLNQTATANAYWEDQTGFGGFATVGLDKPITTASPNEDVIILGMDNNAQIRMVYTGNDLLPFNFFIINSELGSLGTISTINMDKGVITRGNRGFIITSQTGARELTYLFPMRILKLIYRIMALKDSALKGIL